MILKPHLYKIRYKMNSPVHSRNVRTFGYAKKIKHVTVKVVIALNYLRGCFLELQSKPLR